MRPDQGNQGRVNLLTGRVQASLGDELSGDRVFSESEERIMIAIRRVCYGLALVLSLGCQDDTPADPPDCSPGETIACECADGKPGVQGCLLDGTRGECVLCGRSLKQGVGGQAGSGPASTGGGK